MKRHIHEGILYQDTHKRYCLHEPGVPEYKILTCTSGCRLEVWLNRTWIAGHVEGDGEDYWLFADGGGRFLLAEHMKARYTEHLVNSVNVRRFLSRNMGIRRETEESTREMLEKPLPIWLLSSPCCKLWQSQPYFGAHPPLLRG